ncbi:hypothetical protein DMN91_011069 [Ooceraea biroi]|uniref:Uncharacterized protein n=1 Tax=Ooceraea biroi TaxID=2015173 RepID=A0A3L8D8Y8_OOCBI|nr:hypothetical protein DMN91_011069 [Ooceraea biroi]
MTSGDGNLSLASLEQQSFTPRSSETTMCVASNGLLQQSMRMTRDTEPRGWLVERGRRRRDGGVAGVGSWRMIAGGTARTCTNTHPCRRRRHRRRRRC